MSAGRYDASRLAALLRPSDGSLLHTLQQHSRVLEFATVLAPDNVVRRLALGADLHVKRIVRVRSANGEPLVKEIAYFPLALADDLEAEALERASIYDELERRHGVHVTRARETIRPIVLSRSLAAQLGVRTGAPAFHVERTTWAARGPIEWQEAVVRGDRFLYSVELANRPVQPITQVATPYASKTWDNGTPPPAG